MRATGGGGGGKIQTGTFNVARNMYVAFLLVCVESLIYSDTKPLAMLIAVTTL